MVNHTMRYKKKQVAAESLNAGFHGAFAYNFPDHYPDMPYDRLSCHLVWNIVVRALPDHMRTR
jgi:hypothetical protein